MTRRYVGLSGLLLVALLGVAYGATLKHAEEAKELAEKVLTRVVVGDLEGIATLVKPYWSFSEDELEAMVTQTAQQRLLLAQRLGKSIGFTFVRRELVADTFLRLIYIERCEHTGLRWLFTFYKVKDVWKFHGFAWDEEIAQLFNSGPEPGRRDALPGPRPHGTKSQ
jgi:hypothetical protein